MYRNDVAALQDRLAALEAELAERTRTRDEVARMLHDARARARQDAVFAELADGGLVRRRRRMALAGLVALATLFALVAGVSVLASVLGASRPASREQRIAEEIRHFERFADEMCQCTEVSCAQRVADEMTRWGQAMEKELPNPKLDEATTKHATELGMRMGQCMQTAMSHPAPQ